MAKRIMTLPMLDDSPTFKQILDEYIIDCKARGLAPASIDSISAHLTPVVKYFDINTPILDIDFRKVYAKVHERKDISVNTIAGYLRTVKCIIRFANKEYGFNIPAPIIKTEETIKETYTDEELSRLIQKPKKFKSFCEYRNWLMVCLFVDTGIRSGTIRDIRFGDFDFQRCSLSTRHNKTHKVQEIPVSKYLCKEIITFNQIRNGQPDDYLFCDVYGNQLSPNGLKLAINKYNTSRNVKLHSVHAFRHTFARKYLLDLDGDALKLQRLLGHSTLAMTKNYCRIYSQDLINDDKSIYDSLQHHKIHLDK